MQVTEMLMSQLAYSEGWGILMNDVSHRTQKQVVSSTSAWDEWKSQKQDLQCILSSVLSHACDPSIRKSVAGKPAQSRPAWAMSHD